MTGRDLFPFRFYDKEARNILTHILWMSGQGKIKYANFIPGKKAGTGTGFANIPLIDSKNKTTELFILKITVYHRCLEYTCMLANYVPWGLKKASTERIESDVRGGGEKPPSPQWTDE